MKKLFAISNAHIDPVWLWEWQEGATATIATFRTAADFCDEYDGYIFCHNEALLYQWTEEYDPALLSVFRSMSKPASGTSWAAGSRSRTAISPAVNPFSVKF